MKTLKELKERCECCDGHWIWGGPISGDSPRIWAPDYTNGGKMVGQNGARAVWHLKHRKPIPEGLEVFITCGEEGCLKPEHVEAMTRAEYGELLRKTGRHKGLLSKIIANRRINRQRSSVTQDIYAEIVGSSKTGKQITAETGICRTTISRIRTGQATALQPTNPFAGLGA